MGEKIQYIERVCEKHGVWKEKIVYFKNIAMRLGVCQKCLAEEKEIEKKQEEYLRDKRIKEIKDYALRNSNIPERYKAKKFILTDNVSKNKEIFNKLGNKNLYIYGDTGVGKTHFLVKLILEKLMKYPYYINCETFNLTGYKTNDFLENIKEHEIIVFDEAQCILENKLLELAILTAYDNKAILYFGSNIDFKDFSSKISNRIIDRMLEGELQVIHFTGKSLRIYK